MFGLDSQIQFSTNVDTIADKLQVGRGLKVEILANLYTIRFIIFSTASHRKSKNMQVLKISNRLYLIYA